MTIADAAAAEQVADLLFPAWRDPSRLVPGLPEALRPTDEAQSYAIQAAVARRLGAIGGWKVGSPGPDGPCNCAPMPGAGMHLTPARLPAALWPARGVEAEIAFRMGHSLTPREAPYSREEVLAAIDTCHPLIEVVQSRFADPAAEDKLTMLGDFVAHGCFILGASIPGWRDLDFAAQKVELLFGERSVASRTGNPAGDMIRLIQFLANEGAVWAGGLMAGQVITTGSWTGMLFADIDEPVLATFPGLGEVSLVFTS